MKKLLIFLVCLASLAMSDGVEAQTWHNAKDGGYHVFGIGWSRTSLRKYQRLPTLQRSMLKNTELSNNSILSSGLYVRFRTDATAISIKYTMTKSATQHYFVSTFGQSGVDLYARSDDGKTYHWLAPHVGNAAFGTPATANYKNIIPTNMDGLDVCEYVLYLPSLNGVSDLQVGTNTEAKTFEWIEVPEEQECIVAYGGGVVQGASASHPGNTWTNIVGRALGVPVLNFGFMGLAKLDQGIFDVMAELMPRAFIIDAMPDMLNTPDAIVERVVAGVKTLRAANQRPILLVESPGVPDKLIRPNVEALHTAANAKLKEAYDQLVDEGYHNLFYMTQEEIGLVADDFLDGIDVNDLGMKRYADVYLKKLAYIEENKEDLDAIERVEAPVKETGAVYDLNGRRVGGNLQKGIYIRNGRKIAVTE
ncbi:MAG: hypothetical protein J6H19_02970 [Bacteroidaceae bacterium]|nr:hypothetical protein [Bacteroidaceae bacterium]